MNDETNTWIFKNDNLSEREVDKRNLDCYSPTVNVNEMDTVIRTASSISQKEDFFKQKLVLFVCGQTKFGFESSIRVEWNDKGWTRDDFRLRQQLISIRIQWNPIPSHPDDHVFSCEYTSVKEVWFSKGQTNTCKKNLIYVIFYSPRQSRGEVNDLAKEFDLFYFILRRTWFVADLKTRLANRSQIIQILIGSVESAQTCSILDQAICTR